jgi:hypothetical protein
MSPCSIRVKSGPEPTTPARARQGRVLRSLQTFERRRKSLHLGEISQSWRPLETDRTARRSVVNACDWGLCALVIGPHEMGRTNHLPPCDHCDTAKRTATTVTVRGQIAVTADTKTAPSCATWNPTIRAELLKAVFAIRACEMVRLPDHFSPREQQESPI